MEGEDRPARAPAPATATPREAFVVALDEVLTADPPDWSSAR